MKSQKLLGIISFLAIIVVSIMSCKDSTDGENYVQPPIEPIICNDCGKVICECTEIPPIIDGAGVIIAMWDSAGDGWDSSAALRIYVNGNNLSTNARLSDGSGPGYYAFPINTDDVVSLYWVNGGQYDSECAYAVYYNNDPPNPQFNPDPSNWSPANDPDGKVILYKQYGGSGNIGDGTLVGSFTVLMLGIDPSLPPLTGTVSINGTTQIGQILTASTTYLEGSGDIHYQWKRDGINIGTNSSTYIIVPEDGGSNITVNVIRAGNYGSITSEPVAVPNMNTGISNDPSIKLYLDGNQLINSGTTTISQGEGIINIGFDSTTSGSIGSGTEGNPLQLLSGGWVDGSISSDQSGSSIWYSFPVTSGTTYRVWWNDGYAGNGDKSLDIIASAQYENGTSIFSGSDSAWSSPQQFTANQTGVVKVRVQPYSSGDTGTFGIVYTSNNSTRPDIGSTGASIYTDITWYLNGNKVAQGASRTSFILSKQIEGTYNVTVTAIQENGVKHSGSHTFIIRYGNPALPVLTGTVNVSGTGRVGQTLTATASLSGSSGIISYQWKRDGVNIGTNTNSFTLRPEDGGSFITVIVTRSGYSGSVSSSPIQIINTGIIVDPSLNLYMNGSSLANGGTTTISQGTGIVNIGFDSATNINTGVGTESDPFLLPSGGWIEGSITSNSSSTDVWYSFPVSNGTTYRIWWNDGYSGNGDKTLDISASARYENGSLIFSDVDSAWSSPYQFTANQTGVVKIRVQPWNSGNSGTFGIVYTSNNSTRPDVGSTGSVEYANITWFINGNVVSQGVTRTSFTLPRQVRGTYQITVEATPIGGIKNSGSHTLIIQ